MWSIYNSGWFLTNHTSRAVTLAALFFVVELSLSARPDTSQVAGSRCPGPRWCLLHHPDDSSPIRRSQAAVGFLRDSSPRNQSRCRGRLLRALSCVNRSIETAKGQKAELNGSFLLAATSSEFGQERSVTPHAQPDNCCSITSTSNPRLVTCA